MVNRCNRQDEGIGKLVTDTAKKQLAPPFDRKVSTYA